MRPRELTGEAARAGEQGRQSWLVRPPELTGEAARAGERGRQGWLVRPPELVSEAARATPPKRVRPPELLGEGSAGRGAEGRGKTRQDAADND